jgi:hypothetical protein
MIYLIDDKTSDLIMSCFCCNLTSSSSLLGLLPFSTSIMSPKFIVSHINKVHAVGQNGDMRLTTGIIIFISFKYYCIYCFNYLLGIRVSDVVSDVETNKKSLFDPALTLQKYITLPLTVMLTFGISSPLLGLTIFVSILSQTYLNNFMISKYLYYSILQSESMY